MKNLYKLFFALIIFTFNKEYSLAQYPTYTLTATNFQFNSLNHPNDAIEFDIYLLHTNPQVVSEYLYGGGMYFFSFNPEILTVPIPSNTNDTSQISYKIIGSDLPQSWQPRAPSISTASSPAASVLRLAINTFPGLGPGPPISIVYPGTKVVRMRLWNKTAPLNNVPLNLQWRNPPILTFPTRLYAFFEIWHIEITNSMTHFIELNPLNVELSNFSSRIMKNNVTLSWATLTERNNSGFEVSRLTLNDKGQAANNWVRISFVQGNGTATAPNNYTFEDNNLTSGIYNYRLKQIDYNGNFEYFYLSNEVEVGIPTKFELSQNYPNPFNPKTIINYSVPSNVKGETSNVKLIIFDITGKEFDVLVNQKQEAGYYSVEFGASNLSSGVYFYRLSSGSFTMTKKMMVLR